MIGLIQRVQHAHVEVAGKTIGEIAQGLLVLVGVEIDDTETQADKLLHRLLGYRVFADADDKMNLSVQDIHAGVLLVPQFTLAANTRNGMRPSFSSAAPPLQGQHLFQYLVEQAQAKHADVATGCFGADMQVYLQNDGPVTFWLQV